MASVSNRVTVRYGLIHDKFRAVDLTIKNEIETKLRSYAQDRVLPKLNKQISNGGSWVKGPPHKDFPHSIDTWRATVERPALDKIDLRFRNDNARISKGNGATPAGTKIPYVKYLIGSTIGPDGGPLYRAKRSGLTEEFWTNFKKNIKDNVKRIVEQTVRKDRE